MILNPPHWTCATLWKSWFGPPVVSRLTWLQWGAVAYVNAVRCQTVVVFNVSTWLWHLLRVCLVRKFQFGFKNKPDRGGDRTERCQDKGWENVCKRLFTCPRSSRYKTTRRRSSVAAADCCDRVSFKVFPSTGQVIHPLSLQLPPELLSSINPSVHLFPAVFPVWPCHSTQPVSFTLTSHTHKHTHST